MRYLQWFALFVAVAIGDVSMAQVCCPAGCVQSGSGCVKSGPTPTACGTVQCPAWGNSSSGGGSGSGPTVQFPQPLPCVESTDAEAKAMVDKYANKCEADLTATAEFYGCLVEDEAGKAQDKALNMTCGQRKAAYAAECAARCRTFAINYVNLCKSHAKGMDGFWQDAFGDLGGTKYPSARVEGCGPAPKAAGPTAPRPKDAGGGPIKPAGTLANTPKDANAAVKHF
ncbi:MAG TPA: hypothetical protein VMM27_16845 [Casimicrobiaceae bacterium]|nr:hypothetical protein [Casimicrobiaceae bacterium]